LHLSFKLDLLLSLLVGILTHHVLEVTGVFRLQFLSLSQVHSFDFFVVFEELLNLTLVSCKNGASLTAKVLLNSCQLGRVVISHLLELGLHTGDQVIDIIRHLLDSLNVVAIFLIDLVFKLLDQFLFVTDDFGTSSFLAFNVLKNLNESDHD
jgi:hypothetical protein